MPSLHKTLESLYTRFNDPAFIHPDPLEHVVRFSDRKDQEIVGLIAACLAYGRVQTIQRSVATVLAPMESSPHAFILSHSYRDFQALYGNGRFVHRFTRGEELACFLSAIQQVLREFGSLKACFLACDRPGDPTYLHALNGFVTFLRNAVQPPPSSLLPDPAKGSAMKRLHLFLRWMVRHDRVDPGTWLNLSPARLLVPLDTHMHAFGKTYGLTRRKSADLKAALEITMVFRELHPPDPVKYDFALTRLGIFGIRNVLGSLPLSEAFGAVTATSRSREPTRE